jgi:transcriptional regulator with XRE-family HTH domain
MTRDYAEAGREAFAGAVAGQLRAARLRQKLTQAQLAGRTNGRVSKAALANYETRQRSLRIDVFWVLVRALGEDPAALLSAAERESGYGVDESDAPVIVNAAVIQASSDARLAPVQRWFKLRLRIGTTGVHPATLTLDATAINALAALMGTTPADCRAVLVAASAADRSAARADAGPRPDAAALAAAG